jgi:hypothetical protein
LAQAQLDKYKDSEEIWSRVHELMRDAIDTDGTVKTSSELMTLLKGDANY